MGYLYCIVRVQHIPGCGVMGVAMVVPEAGNGGRSGVNGINPLTVGY